MMKSIIYNIKVCVVVVALAISATSCLEKYPDSALQTEKSMKTFDDAEQIVTGIYALLKSSALFSGYSTLAPDIQTDLVYAVKGYTNQYGDIWMWKIRSTTAEVESVYAGFYNIISNCNFYLENIDAVRNAQYDDTKITMLDFYTGEIYTIRALCYSELIKFFCVAYNPDTAHSDLGVVLRKYYSKPEEAKRASLYDSYQFVLSDLAKAEEILDSENDQYSGAYAIRAMAEALHARVALYMQDWDTAIKYSTRLIENEAFALSSAVTQYGSTGQTYYQYMWNYDLATEIIWQVYFTPTSYGGALGSVFLHFTSDYYYFYPDYVPAQWVLNLYASNDGRYDAYFYNTTTGYDHGLTWPLLVKYHGNGDFISQKIYHVTMPKPFRLAEQYLIRAEAYCRQETPNFSKASADIVTLRNARYASGSSVNLTKDNYIQQLSDERVRELIMEGHRLQDLKRWNLGFERTPQASTITSGSSLKIEAGDYRFVWPIPRHEIEAPGSKVQQNAGY